MFFWFLFSCISMAMSLRKRKAFSDVDVQVGHAGTILSFTFSGMLSLGTVLVLWTRRLVNLKRALKVKKMVRYLTWCKPQSTVLRSVGTRRLQRFRKKQDKFVQVGKVSPALLLWSHCKSWKGLQVFSSDIEHCWVFPVLLWSWLDVATSHQRWGVMPNAPSVCLDVLFHALIAPVLSWHEFLLKNLKCPCVTCRFSRPDWED